jgi:ribonucleoside-diphosphate reductase alpha chain
MMAAAQPFISGAISKTINMPNDATVEDVQDAYMLSWKLALKANALYRDGSKLSQPLNAAAHLRGRRRGDDARRGAGLAKPMARAPSVPPSASSSGRRARWSRERRREKLPDRRKGYTQKAVVGGHKVYLRTGEYEDGRSARSSSTCTRKAPPSAADEQLRHRHLARPAIRRAARGVRRRLHLHPLRAAGMVQGNDSIKNATSILDYVFRELASATSAATTWQRGRTERPAGRHRARLDPSGARKRLRGRSVPGVRVDDPGPQRRLPQVQLLRRDDRLLLSIAPWGSDAPPDFY